MGIGAGPCPLIRSAICPDKLIVRLAKGWGPGGRGSDSQRLGLGLEEVPQRVAGRSRRASRAEPLPNAAARNCRAHGRAHREGSTRPAESAGGRFAGSPQGAPGESEDRALTNKGHNLESQTDGATTAHGQLDLLLHPVGQAAAIACQRRPSKVVSIVRTDTCLTLAPIRRQRLLSPQSRVSGVFLLL